MSNALDIFIMQQPGHSTQLSGMAACRGDSTARVDVIGVRCYSSTDLSNWQDEGLSQMLHLALICVLALYQVDLARDGDLQANSRMNTFCKEVQCQVSCMEGLC